MTRIDFYVLKGSMAGERERYACRLVEKAYKLGHKIQLRTRDEQQSQQMDNLLWTFRQGSFVPHAHWTGLDAKPADTPVLIGSDAIDQDSEVLINLAETTPDSPDRFGRIAELVNDDEHIRQQARLRYRHYRELGYTVNSHNVETNR